MKQVILIIDDEEEIRSSLSAIVDQLGFTPLTAGNGLDALELLQSERVDLIITDLMMPQMDGMKFIVKSRSMNPKIPIAVISAYGDVKNATFALTRGAFNFITKPFSIREVENIINKGLRLRELALGTDKILRNIRNRTEIVIPSYPRLPFTFSRSASGEALMMKTCSTISPCALMKSSPTRLSTATRAVRTRTFPLS
jgi:DNA-binding NtrC family response regulator